MMQHLKEMEISLPKLLHKFWYLCWGFITPILLIVVTIISWVQHSPDGFQVYEYPTGVQFMGWGIELFSVCVILAFAIHAYVSRIIDGKSVGIKAMFFETNSLWGPREDAVLEPNRRSTTV